MPSIGRSLLVTAVIGCFLSANLCCSENNGGSSMKAENVSRDGVPTTTVKSDGSSSDVQLKIVESESGFNGAVTVASQTKTDDLNCVTVNVPYLDVKGHPLWCRERRISTRALYR